MVIHIDPNRIRASGLTVKSGERRRADNAESEMPKPARAHVNYMPSPESLRTLINSAVAALRRGITWDRGTILNLLV